MKMNPNHSISLVSIMYVMNMAFSIIDFEPKFKVVVIENLKW